MFFTKKKKADGPIVWMIQKKGVKPEQFLGVCKSEMVYISTWQACFRFSDIDAAGIMIYWLAQSGKIKIGECEAVPVQLTDKAKRQ